MSKQIFDYITSNIDHIRPSLAGIYFLIQGEKVLYIGESKDIKREILRHSKKGQEFQKVGILLFEGSQEQRKKYTQQLIQKLKNEGKAAQSTNTQISTKRTAQKGTAKAESSRVVSLPQSRLDMIRPPKQNPVRQPDPEKPALRASSHMKSAGDQSPISAETKEALKDWTQKVTREAMAEMKIETSPPPPTKNADPDLPDWLDELALKPIEKTVPGNNAPASAKAAKFNEKLPDWAQPEDSALAKTPVHNSAPQKEGDKKGADKNGTPEWLKDIDINQSDPNTVPPFG
jgi:hypothetical protein